MITFLIALAFLVGGVLGIVLEFRKIASKSERGANDVFCPYCRGAYMDRTPYGNYHCPKCFRFYRGGGGK